MNEEPPDELDQRGKREDLRGRFIGNFLNNYRSKREAAEKESSRKSGDFEEGWEKGTSGRFSRNIVIILGGVLIVGLVVWFAILQLIPPTSSPAGNKVRDHFMVHASPEEIMTSTDDAVRGFMEGKTLEERARFVVGGEEVLRKMKGYYARPGVLAPQGCRKIPGQFSSAAGGLPLVGARATDLTGKDDWFFSLVPVADRMLVDWESTVGYCEMPWLQFIEERPTESQVMRVYLLRFIDEKLDGKGDAPLFYRVNNKGKMRAIIAEPKRGSEVELLLESLVPSKIDHPITVRIRFHEGKPFAEITEVVHDLWVDTARIEALLSVE